eukprot:2200263-Pyramimonas_sp.AAC.1
MASANVRFAASASARSKHVRSDAVQCIALDTAHRCTAWPPTPGAQVVLLRVPRTANQFSGVPQVWFL